MDNLELYEVIGRLALKNAAKGRRITELLGVTNREVERRRTAERRVAELEERVTLLSGGPLVLTSDIKLTADQLVVYLRDWNRVNYTLQKPEKQFVSTYESSEGSLPVYAAPDTLHHRIQRSLERLRKYTQVDDLGKPITPPAKSEPLVFGENWLD